MIAGNITETITGKFPTAYRKPEENDMRKEKPKIAVLAAEYSSEKNRKIRYVQNVLINSISIVMAKREKNRAVTP
jgi:hypothetical protein